MKVAFDQITSSSNPLIKQLRSLERKKGRNETGLFLAEGVRLVEQALARDWQVETLIVSNAGLSRPYIMPLAKRIKTAGGRVIQVPDRLAKTLARKDNPQAVIAAIKQRPLTLSDLSNDPTGLWIGLYECRDPGNLGTILRTADCAGAAGVILIENSCDAYSVEAVRASMGSLFDVALARASFSDFNTWRRALGLQMVAASVNGDRRHDQVPFERPSLILMGNEQAGLPPEIERLCDTLCLIPMRGGADSLNLAQASAILLYEAWRQRGFG
ncbi:MAG: RNA methyltransferase [Pseudomonadota bacterium]